MFSQKLWQKNCKKKCNSAEAPLKYGHSLAKKFIFLKFPRIFRQFLLKQFFCTFRQISMWNSTTFFSSIKNYGQKTVKSAILLMHYQHIDTRWEKKIIFLKFSKFFVNFFWISLSILLCKFLSGIHQLFFRQSRIIAKNDKKCNFADAKNLKLYNLNLIIPSSSLALNSHPLWVTNFLQRTGLHHYTSDIKSQNLGLTIDFAVLKVPELTIETRLFKTNCKTVLESAQQQIAQKLKMTEHEHIEARIKRLFSKNKPVFSWIGFELWDTLQAGSAFIARRAHIHTIW